eukprot:CAMPEP_0196575154 /NCGR_PEP_ID=MMETSP1081-20130531/4691_1 /TAXON_ID=36882 /ORGANISM="Pyramimonas amylifera, Strain CCMP720" /LENGTH=304 /DNA_ID=CAMNT_0041893361 /DNA_START=32 /DNA_END=946 /DNA_ORIENTATION=-
MTAHKSVWVSLAIFLSVISQGGVAVLAAKPSQGQIKLNRDGGSWTRTECINSATECDMSCMEEFSVVSDGATMTWTPTSREACGVKCPVMKATVTDEESAVLEGYALTKHSSSEILINGECYRFYDIMSGSVLSATIKKEEKDEVDLGLILGLTFSILFLCIGGAAGALYFFYFRKKGGDGEMPKVTDIEMHSDSHGMATNPIFAMENTGLPLVHAAPAHVVSASTTPKATSSPGAAPGKKIADMSVEDVCAFVDSIGLPRQLFVENGVDGDMLLDLSDEELQGELKLKPLQIKKLKTKMAERL